MQLTPKAPSGQVQGVPQFCLRRGSGGLTDINTQKGANSDFPAYLCTQSISPTY